MTQGRGRQFGAVAQLGERVNGIHEVSGSIPLGSSIRCAIRLGSIARSCGATSPRVAAGQPPAVLACVDTGPEQVSGLRRR